MKRRNLLAGAAMRLRRLIGFAVPLLLLLGGAQGAWGKCVRFPGATVKNISIDMGKITVPNDLAINGLIATKNFAISEGAGQFAFNCFDGGGVVTGTVLKGTALPSDSTIYSTDVSGVGIRLSRVSATTSLTYPHRVSVRNGNGYYFGAGLELKVELRKTAAVTGNGPLAAGLYSTTYGDGDMVSMLNVSMSFNGTTIITPSCTVDAGSRNIPVSFGKVLTTSFKGRGSTAGDRNFNIQLNCRAGQNAQNTVQIKMDATADLVNVAGVLRITPAGTNTAGGVGIQIVNASTQTAVKFGDTVDVGSSRDGSYALPYTARYYQTGNAVTTGQANGTATFTLSYK